MNACSGPIWAGCVPPPRPMNQRTTLPPFGPGPAAIGAGVMRTVDGDGSAVWAGADAAAAVVAAGDGLTDELHAVASSTTALPIRKVLFRADPGRFISVVSSVRDLVRSPPLR